MSPPYPEVMSVSRVPVALTIAGSDSGGGAGIQADLKTFAALGVYGTSAITAVTAQNTLGVQHVATLAPEIVAAQIRSVVSDIRPRAAKTGMLANIAIVQAVIQALAETPNIPLVVDPVTHAKSGDALLAPEAISYVREHLLPRATVVTPNLPEAIALTGLTINSDEDMLTAGYRLLETGAHAVVIKGGHRDGAANDLYLDHDQQAWLPGCRITTRCTHGTGCTFSAAITAHLAHGMTLRAAVEAAKAYVSAALRAGYEIGAGHSPVDHFHAGIMHRNTQRMAS